MADPVVRASFQAITGQTIRYTFAPALAGAGASGVTLTQGAVAWGAYKDLAAAKAITTDFWICGLGHYTSNDASVFEIQVTDGTPTLLAAFILNPTAVTLNLNTQLVPIPIFVAANTQIQARAGGAGNGKTINVALMYATGLV